MAAAADITLAANALRVGLRLGDELGALAFGLGLDDLRLAIALTARVCAMPSKLCFMLSYTLVATSSCRSMRCTRTSMSCDAELQRALRWRSS